MTIPEKLRQAYHNDLSDVPLLLDAADEIDRLREALGRIEGRAANYQHGDSRVEAVFSGIAAIARATLEFEP